MPVGFSTLYSSSSTCITSWRTHFHDNFYNDSDPKKCVAINIKLTPSVLIRGSTPELHLVVSWLVANFYIYTLYKCEFYICYPILEYTSVDDTTGVGIKHTNILCGSRWHDRQVGFSGPGEHFPDCRRHLTRHDVTHIRRPWRACHDCQIKYSNLTVQSPSTHHLAGSYPQLLALHIFGKFFRIPVRARIA